MLNDLLPFSFSAVVPSRKDVCDHAEEKERASRFHKHIKAFAPEVFGSDEAIRLARFLAVQCKDEQACNIHRHCDIIEMTQQHPELLTRVIVDKLCKLQRAMVTDKAEEENDVEVLNDSKVVIESINTLVACMEHGDAVQFFGKVCTPTTDENKALRKKYADLEFAREVVVESILGPQMKELYGSGSEYSEEERAMDLLLQQIGVALLILVFGGAFVYWHNFT